MYKLIYYLRNKALLKIQKSDQLKSDFCILKINVIKHLL